MLVLTRRKDANIVNATFCVSYTSKNFLHSRLGIFRWSLESHWYAVLADRPERRDDGVDFLAFLVQFKGVLLHGYVQLGQNSYPVCLCKISVIIGKLYCVRLITLFNSRILETHQTRLSFLGMMNVGSPHSVSRTGKSTPISTRWSNYFLKVAICTIGMGYGRR